MRKLLVIGLFASCTTLHWAQTSSPQLKPFVKVDAPVVALTHVRIIDGTGAAAREDQTLIIRTGKIDSVGAASTANVPKDAQVLDLSGSAHKPRNQTVHFLSMEFLSTSLGRFWQVGNSTRLQLTHHSRYPPNSFLIETTGSCSTQRLQSSGLMAGVSR